MPEGVHRATAAVKVKRLLATVLGELLTEKWPASFVNCVGERMCVDGVRLFNGDVRMVSVKSRIISGGFYSSVCDYDAILNVFSARQTEGFVLREQRVYARLEF